MVPVGVVGLSPVWETRYGPALKALRQRIAVRAVYDPVLSRAEHAAAELGAVPVSGMRALARRDDLKALLVFDTGWTGTAAVRLLCDAGRPMFLGGLVAAETESLDRLVLAAARRGTMVMPALAPRYTPATNRLRELMATRLGRPISIEIDARPPGERVGPSHDNGRPSDTFELFTSRIADWCCYVVPTPPTDVVATSERPPDATSASPSGGLRLPESIRFTFAMPRAGGLRPEVLVRLRSSQTDGDDDESVTCYRVQCERGEAVLDAVDRISWRTDDEQAEENLVADRPAVQVMLDHFCRRVVGGLIPVAGLEDVRRSRRLIHAALDSHRSGTSVRLNGRVSYD